MNLLEDAISYFVRTTGFEIIKHPDGRRNLRRRVSLGRKPIADMKTILNVSPKCIFDVGANDGETARRFSSSFPTATIYSFEPDHQTFRRLAETTRKLENVRIINRALGQSVGQASLFRNSFDATNSLLPSVEDAEEYVVRPDYLRPIGTETVMIDTIDHFCSEQGIDGIDILKIDTQGYELEVLAGASETLARRGVPLIYAEVSFIRFYEHQPLFDEVYGYLYDRDYRMVGIYETGYLTHYYQVGGNALFVHRSIGKRRD